MSFQVQKVRIQEQPPEEQEEFANQFTNSSVELLNRVMIDPIPWVGLDDTTRNGQLSQIQMDLDEIAASLIQHSSQQDSWDYLEFKGKFF